MDIKKIESILNLKITKTKVFETAFTHRSYLNENKDYKNNSNERLEFLGDAVLQLLSSEYLFTKYKDTPEGDLTAYRSSLVNTKSLAFESKRLGFGQFLLMSKGEEANGGRESEYILANTFESVLGAIYIQQGLQFCKTYLKTNLFYKIDDIIKQGKHKDPKSHYQEQAQAKWGVTPTYKVTKQWGPDHDKQFEVAVLINKKLIAKGTGTSKQKAEAQAAKQALIKLN